MYMEDNMSCNKQSKPDSLKDVLKLIREGTYDPIDRTYDYALKERKK